jgi:hypothetical protein
MNTERINFGHWLSGFVAGEATFLISAPNSRHGRPVPRASFRIVLRRDDEPVLHAVRDFWGCGVLTTSANARCKTPNAKPIAIYNVTRLSDLVSVVIPHFHAFPLRAKKAVDFATWERAVSLWATVSARHYPRFRDSRNRIVGVGTKWTDAEVQQFKALAAELKSLRTYTHPAVY